MFPVFFPFKSSQFEPIIKMALTNLEKAKKAEADALKNLRLLGDQATLVLGDSDRLNHLNEFLDDIF